MYVSVYLIEKKNPTIFPYLLRQAHFSLLGTNKETVKELMLGNPRDDKWVNNTFS